MRPPGGPHPPAPARLAVRAAAALAALATLVAGCTGPPPDDDAAPTPTAPAPEGPHYALVDGDFCTSLESDGLATALTAVTPGAELTLSGAGAPELAGDSHMAAYVTCNINVTSDEIHTSGGEVALMVFHDSDAARTTYHRGVTGEMMLLDTEDTQTVDGPWDEATYVEAVRRSEPDKVVNSSFIAHHGNLYLRVGYRGTIKTADIPPDEAVATIRSVAAALLEHAIAHAPCDERCP